MLSQCSMWQLPPGISHDSIFHGKSQQGVEDCLQYVWVLRESRVG